MITFDDLKNGTKEVKQPKEKIEVDKNLIVDYPEERNIVDDTNAEIKTLKKSFQSKLDKEKEAKDKNINPNFWFAVYFQDEDQKNEFLEKSKASAITSGVYIDGLKLAEVLGIKMERKDIKAPGKFKSFKQ